MEKFAIFWSRSVLGDDGPQPEGRQSHDIQLKVEQWGGERQRRPTFGIIGADDFPKQCQIRSN